jgi:hypothetical protein
VLFINDKPKQLEVCIVKGTTAFDMAVRNALKH